jgi:opacity protein-like surface antigen
MIHPDKKTLTTSLALVSIFLTTQGIAETGGYYVGIFGGGGSTSTTSVQQIGTAFYAPPKPVDAQGMAPASATSMAGAHVGFEWDELTLGSNQSEWGLRPALEIEGFYLGNNPSATIVSPNTPGVPNHTFQATLPNNNGVFVANAVFAVKTPLSNSILPYAGAGVGGATMNISSATSEQLNPAEPGLNHFNTNPNASGSALAVNAKLGVRGEIVERLSLFAEYRYVYLGSTGYTFGQTQGAGSTCCPTHVPTSNWNLNMGAQNYFLGVAGIQYRF